MEKLWDNLAKLGYPLVTFDENFDVNGTLAEALKTNLVRVLEGFPVLLANAGTYSWFDDKKVEELLGSQDLKDQFKELVLVSLGLYKFMGVYFSWAKRFEDELPETELKRVKEYRNYFAHGTDFQVNQVSFSVERMLTLFKNYFVKQFGELKKETQKFEDYSVEYALSQVFSPRQKELFLKRVRGERFTKTEREYFSRTVKKKVQALANPELERMAKLVLQGG
jgi:hypothetical protein